MDQNSEEQNLTPNKNTAQERLDALTAASADVTYSLSADWKIMHPLDGRGFLLDANQPITNWKEKNVFLGDLKIVDEAIASAIKNKKMFELEHRVNRADGTIGWTYSRAVPILDKSGNIKEWYGIAKDISKRKEAEIALTESRKAIEDQQQIYETIISGTPDLMYVFDLNYRFTYANKALLNMWGKTWDNAIGKRLLDNGYEPWHAEMHEKEIDQVVATRKPIRGEVSFPHATLGKRIYDYIFTPVMGNDGKVIAVAGTTRDITEINNIKLKLQETSEELQTTNEELRSTVEEMAATNEELIASNEQLIRLNDQLLEARKKIEDTEIALRLAIEGADFGTWYINSVTREFITDGRLKELFGFYPDEELTIEQAIAQISEEYREMVSQKLENAIYNNGEYDVTYPVEGLHDGKLRWLRAIGNLKADSSGAFSAFTGVVMDVTEQKTDELRKNDFIAMVSHELKTPLTSLKGYIQIVLRKLLTMGDDSAIGALEKAFAQTVKMTGMINGFLTVSRLESGKISIEPTEFDLALLIREAEQETHTTINTHKVIFDPVNSTIINADHDKIGQVVHNLISNAVKYAPSNSTIRISCTNDESTAYVAIADDGIGISAPDLSKIFDRFYRVQDSKMSTVSGFGIGLYLCKEIIDRHGGKIWAQSEQGKGSIFSFSLPMNS
ncbi:ATP-binding protein [Pedobacter boryungensis]|uniref:histidine kinase n=1 Tax=Pedobacter boryungensis TaxID=869962 RepID=A0ABX2DBX0_9SPHI|nr:ATP-binding protein [Pedobacter boryungensis]NQX31059.1 PAS domain S-box protein [Pedobacter boryungensis]